MVRRLYSINFMHAGRGKIWYGVPRRHAPKFDKVAKELVGVLRRLELARGMRLVCANFCSHNTVTARMDLGSRAFQNEAGAIGLHNLSNKSLDTANAWR